MQKKKMASYGLLTTTLLGIGGFFGFQPAMRLVYPEPAAPAPFEPVQAEKPVPESRYTKQDFLDEVGRQVAGVVADFEARPDAIIGIALRSGGGTQCYTTEEEMKLVVPRRGKDTPLSGGEYNPEDYMVLLDLTKIRHRLRKEWEKLPEGERPTRDEVHEAAQVAAAEKGGKAYEEMRTYICGQIGVDILPSNEDAMEYAKRETRFVFNVMLAPQFEALEMAEKKSPVQSTPPPEQAVTQTKPFTTLHRLISGGTDTPEPKDNGPSR